MTNHLGTAGIIRANSRDLPLPDDSVDLVVTSPPYFALRSYQDGGEHYQGQIGDEPTPAEFVASLLEVTRECMRVLKPSGSLWVNLGDKYSNGKEQKWSTQGISTTRKTAEGTPSATGAATSAEMASGTRGLARPKSLLGLPWRFALACVDDLGLILRAEVIWSKPNGLPESVTDRVRRSHETWFHFTLNPRYYSALDNIREGYSPATAARYAAGYNARNVDEQRLTIGTKLGGDTFGENPLGKLPGSVWQIPTQPLRVPESLGIDHFAAFPMEFPRRIIQGWSPCGVCTACGEGRRPVSEGERTDGAAGPVIGAMFGQSGRHSTATGKRHEFATSRTITGEACACPDTTAPTTPGVVLDPFGGTGTTALVAKALGRNGITVDMSADYCRLAKWRTTDPDQLAAAMQVDKPAKQIDGQADLFALLVEEPR